MTEANALAAVLRARAHTEGASLWLPTSGPSMGSTIPAGESVRVGRWKRPPRPGEVWVFVDEHDRPIAHRYLRQVEQGLVFRGDATEFSDTPVAADRVVGPVLAAGAEGDERRVERRIVRPLARAVLVRARALLLG